MGIQNPNSTDYVHPNEPNILNIHKAMDYNPMGQPVLRTTGDSYSWQINISNGTVDGTGYIEKFGMNTDVDSNKETIWDVGGIYQYLSTAQTVSATSTSPDDNAAGTGARTIEVQGLDANYQLVYDSITVNGAPGTVEFLRVFRARVVTAGTSGINEGVITVDATTDAITVAGIGIDGTGSNAAGRGQTFMSLYTVPAGKTAYLTQWTVGCGKQNTDAVATFMARPQGGAWNAKDIITVQATTYAKDYKIPLQFTEKTDIEVRAYSTTNNSLVSSTFNLLLIDN